MDFLSLSIAFLLGAFTGAAGNYLADKFTDARREKKEAAALKRLWRDIEAKFPEIINEMRSDILSTQGKGVRAFFLKKAILTSHSPASHLLSTTLINTLS